MFDPIRFSNVPIIIIVNLCPHKKGPHSNAKTDANTDTPPETVGTLGIPEQLTGGQTPAELITLQTEPL